MKLLKMTTEKQESFIDGRIL